MYNHKTKVQQNKNMFQSKFCMLFNQLKDSDLMIL